MLSTSRLCGSPCFSPYLYHRYAPKLTTTFCWFSEEFLRDGDQLAARMTGTITVDGVVTKFESFMFAKIDEGSGKMASLVERSVWGAADKKEWEHGV